MSRVGPQARWRSAAPAATPLHRRDLHVTVMAKEPRPGRVKTRLSPPLTPEQAADVAAACLSMTLEAVAACSAPRRILVLDGAPGEWLPPGFTVYAQRGDGLAERLAQAWRSVDGPGLQIGMDTPQVTAHLLDDCLDRLGQGGSSALLGMATDGGWWGLGMARDWRRDVFRGVPMSHATTGAKTLASLRRAGHRVAQLPSLTDVDTYSDALSLAGQLPGSPLERVLTTTSPRLADHPGVASSPAVPLVAVDSARRPDQLSGRAVMDG